jgi:hypothetical protein
MGFTVVAKQALWLIQLSQRQQSLQVLFQQREPRLQMSLQLEILQRVTQLPVTQLQPGPVQHQAEELLLTLERQEALVHEEPWHQQTY